jgi:hypothetical protein
MRSTEDPSRKRPKNAKFPYFPLVNPRNIEHNSTVGGHPKCSSSTKYLASKRSEKNKNSIFEKTNLIQ